MGECKECLWLVSWPIKKRGKATGRKVMLCAHTGQYLDPKKLTGCEYYISMADKIREYSDESPKNS